MLLAALAGALLQAACQDKPQAQPVAAAAQASSSPIELHYPVGSPQLTLIRSSVVEELPLPLSQPLEARLSYDEDATARISVPVSGRVVELLARPGDAVRAGQPLLVIDSPDVGSALADLQRADADVQLKRKAAARLRELAPGDAVAGRELEQAEADLAQADAEHARAERRLRNLNPLGLPVHGQRLTLRSPLNGVVTERNVGPAMELSPSLPAPLLVVSDLGRLWVLVDLPERLIDQVHGGDKLLIESEAASDSRREARVIQVGQVVDPNTRRATLRALLDNRDGRLLPEMFVRAWLQSRDGDRAVRIPNAAIVNRGVHAYVFVETEPGHFVQRRVELAARGGDYSFAKEGLKAGERVVVSGALLLDAELSAPADVEQ
jgi:cobalt-zinc-cadmium efflux system membrane fusion protein